jgi:hypothetical protein
VGIAVDAGALVVDNDSTVNAPASTENTTVNIIGG